MIIQLVRLNFFLKKKISKAGFGFNITLSKDCGRNYCLEEKKNPSYSKRHPKEIVVNNVVTIWLLSRKGGFNGMTLYILQ